MTIYETLTAELADARYAGLSDAQRMAELYAETEIETYSRFVSLRTIAAVLDDSEYAAFRAFAEGVAQAGPRQADMVALLEMPGTEEGAGGGIDVGLPVVREFLDIFAAQEGMAQTAQMLKALAERATSRARILGINPQLGNFASARKMMEEA